MHETAHAFFHLDHPAPGESLPAGPAALRGWAVGKPGHYLVDIRARQGGRTHCGIHGFLRADLAQHFRTREARLPAGFELPLTLAPGDNPVEIEGCDITGAWRPLAQLRLNATGTEPKVAPPTVPIVPASDFGCALRLLLRQLPDRSVREAAATVAGWLPVPLVTRFAHPPFHGHLHHPVWIARAGFGRMLVEGWLFHDEFPLKGVAATVDLHAWQSLHHGGAFAYVPTLYPQFPTARAGRIDGAVHIPAQLPRPLSLRIYARLPDDSWHLCHVQRVHTFDTEEEKRPYPPRSLVTFWRAARALRAACRARGLVIAGGRPFRQEMRAAWREYRTCAPARRRPPAGEATAPAHPLHPEDRPLRHVWLVTHNINLEGAPLFLLELARHLAAGGTRLSLLSAEDGPLHAEFVQLGASVQIIDDQPLLESASARALRTELAGHGRRVDFGDCDLVVANTVSCYWAVHLAHRAGRRSLWYIHESTTPGSFFLGHMAPECLPVVKQSFASATHVSFLTAATRRYYDDLLSRPNHSLNPGWIDVAGIDRHRREHDRQTLRAALGLSPETRLVLNLGTVCDRKGQQTFAHAVDLLWRSHPALAQPALFLMVGGRDTLFDRWLADTLGCLDRTNLRVHPETPEPYRYYGAADMFVCSSYEESFPRVLLEAMAFALPIISSEVHGVPEITRSEREALLVPAGDSAALAAALARLLADDPLARSLGRAARERVVTQFDAAVMLPRHAALAVTTAHQPPPP